MKEELRGKETWPMWLWLTKASEVCVAASTLGLVAPGTIAQLLTVFAPLHSELYIVWDTHTFVCSFVHWSIYLGLFCALNFDIGMRGGKPNTDKAISFSPKPQCTLTASPLRFFYCCCFSLWTIVIYLNVISYLGPLARPLKHGCGEYIWYENVFFIVPQRELLDKPELVISYSILKLSLCRRRGLPSFIILEHLQHCESIRGCPLKGMAFPLYLG